MITNYDDLLTAEIKQDLSFQYIYIRDAQSLARKRILKHEI